MYFYVPELKFNSQCKIAEAHFIAHALDNPGVFEISISFDKNIKKKKKNVITASFPTAVDFVAFYVECTSVAIFTVLPSSFENTS